MLGRFFSHNWYYAKLRSDDIRKCRFHAGFAWYSSGSAGGLCETTCEKIEVMKVLFLFIRSYSGRFFYIFPALRNT